MTNETTENIIINLKSFDGLLKSYTGLSEENDKLKQVIKEISDIVNDSNHDVSWQALASKLKKVREKIVFALITMQ